MAEFKDRDELEVWLEDQSRDVSVVIAARTSLRVLPLLAVEFAENKLYPNRVTGAIALSVFRATAVSWVAGTYAVYNKRLAAAAKATAAAASVAGTLAAIDATEYTIATAIEAAACAFAGNTYAGRAALVANFSTRVADAVLVAVIAARAEYADAIGLDWETVEADAVAAADEAAHAARIAIWEAVSADATRVKNGTARKKLAGEPLWENGTPAWATQHWGELRKTLLGKNSDWRVWTDWYEARLVGRPTYPHFTAKQNEQLEIARATVADEIWEQGPTAVNAEIGRLEKEILGKEWEAELAQRPRQQSTAAIGTRLAEDPTRYAAETGDLASLFDAQIVWWESKKPNQNDEDWQDHYEFLKQIRTDFSHLTTQIEQLKTQLTPKNQQSAGEQALVLQESLTTWLKDFGKTISESGKATALLSMITGATYALVTITSANPTIALGIAAAAIGGRSLTEAAGSLRGTKDKAADKPPEKDGSAEY